MLKIRTFLVIILVAALLPLAALDLYNYQTNLQARRRIILSRNLEVAKSVAVGFRTFILAAVQTEEAGGLAIEQGVLKGDQITGYLKELQARNPHLSSITYAGPSGRIIATTARKENPVPRRSIRAINKGRDWAVSALHPDGRRSAEFHVTSAVRVDGQLKALVSGVINDTMVFDFIKIRIGRRGNIGIIDSNGRAAALSFRSHLTWPERDRRFIPSIRTALAGRPATIEEFHDPLGNVDRMGASVPIEGLGWAANVFQPVSEVLGPVRRESLVEAGTSMAVSFAALALVFLIARVITGPIAELAAGTEEFRQGRYGHRLPTHFRVKEISELARALNAAAAKTQQRFEAERHIAGTLQASLLPAEAPQVPGYEIGTRYASATEQALVGGDFYDFIFLGPGKAGLVIGDVQGKGVDAAVTTVTTKFALRDLAVRHQSPAVVLHILNKICRRELLPEQFITLIYLVLDTQTGKLEYASAGHHPPLICAAGACRELAVNGPALGIFEEADYEIGRELLAPREILVLYTDGIVEARKEAELYGLERLTALVAKHAEASPQLICELVYQACVDFSGQRLHDDLALVMLKLFLCHPR